VTATSDHLPIEIRLEGVSKSFGDHEVLRDINLTIHRGELVALVGGSGSGKSVLLDCMTGLLRPTSGRVLVANHSLEDAPLQDLARLDHDELDEIRLHWSIVFQRNALYSGPVYDNIALWLQQNTKLSSSEIAERVEQSLRAVGFDRPEEIAQKSRSELSGGMAKRVAIARAIAMAPDIIFYDEPTSGLDPRLSSQIHDLISRTHAETAPDGERRTSLVITHDKDLLARLQPRVVMLHDHGVHFDGAFRDFAESDSDVIRPYFELMPTLQAMAPETR
jgi:phospholipid/cholesterol/gamma-HCH transport system ATP-binding protein